jgi:hypothetical protein
MFKLKVDGRSSGEPLGIVTVLHKIESTATAMVNRNGI